MSAEIAPRSPGRGVRGFCATVENIGGRERWHAEQPDSVGAMALCRVDRMIPATPEATTA